LRLVLGRGVADRHEPSDAAVEQDFKDHMVGYKAMNVGAPTSTPTTTSASPDPTRDPAYG
jgi:hypothetical protein